MPIDPEQFRDVMRFFPAGVTIVTVKAGEQRHGLTVSAFASVSPEPPLVSVMIDQRHRAYGLMEEPGAVFAVNFLRSEQIELSNRFAWVKDEDRFALGSWGTATTGAPILKDALAWLDCTIFTKCEAGTHTIYVGRVEDAAAPEAADEWPLVYWNRGYRHLVKPQQPAPPSEGQS